MFLTVGEWMTRVWSEDIRDSAIISMKVNPNQLTILSFVLRLTVLANEEGQKLTFPLDSNEDIQ